MQNTTAELAKNTREQFAAGAKTTLDQRYHQIGISAVAAAVRYQGGAKNPAYAPAENRWENFDDDAA